MADVVRYTPDELAEIDKKFKYTIYGQGIKVYVADSSVPRRRTLLNDLGKAGFDMVEDASKTFELQTSLNKCDSPIIAVLLDLSLPKLKPGEFIKQILGNNPAILVVVTYERTPQKLVDEAIAGGAVAVMERPYTSDDVISKLASLGVKS